MDTITLILSTDGTASRNYMDTSEASQIEVPRVEDIRYSRLIRGAAEHYAQRGTAHVDLTKDQALGVAVKLLMSLVDQGVLQGWNLKYPERATPEDDDALLDEVYGVDRPEPCKHGHLDCSTVEGGACANEEYARRLTAKHG